jgi:hypothetical protein
MHKVLLEKKSIALLPPPILRYAFSDQEKLPENDVEEYCARSTSTIRKDIGYR